MNEQLRNPQHKDMKTVTIFALVNLFVKNEKLDETLFNNPQPGTVFYKSACVMGNQHVTHQPGTALDPRHAHFLRQGHQ
jgi:hypothetical protein